MAAAVVAVARHRAQELLERAVIAEFLQHSHVICTDQHNTEAHSELGPIRQTIDEREELGFCKRLHGKTANASAKADHNDDFAFGARVDGQ